LVDLAIALIIGNWGSKKTVGFWASFITSLILTPIVGLFVVGFSTDKVKVVHRYQAPYEEAKKEEFKGNYTIAIDKSGCALLFD
jgi:large-conductance mechanosensitive channel